MQTATAMRVVCEEDVPVYGLVKKEVSGKVTMELIAWGDEEEKK